jgi:hypothetical protein
MREVMLSYFGGEKYSAVPLIAAGVVALAASVVLLSPRWGLRSLGVTVGILALLHLGIGMSVYLRTGPQVNQLLAQLESDPGRFYDEETARMITLQGNLVSIEYVELAVVLLSAIAAVAWKTRPGLAGVALGLLLNVAFVLAFDLVAERRGAVYLAALESRR